LSCNSEEQSQSIDDGAIRNSEKEEIQFRNFINNLLRAQGYEFLNESDLFSNETLRHTMAKLCEIIAEEVKAESCTIHLKLYDPTGLRPSSRSNNGSHGLDLNMEDEVENRIKNVADNWGISPDSAEKAVFRDIYWNILANTLSFPYWRYPKGVARLFAANDASPWVKKRKGTDEQESASADPRAIPSKSETPPTGSAPKRLRVPDQKNFVSLESGITADIFQDNFAKIRDPLSIRSSRQMRKLGGVDYLVWKNRNWRESFKNFYGSPIRIHPTGEVIGILKVENKHGRREQHASTNDDEIENAVDAILELRAVDVRYQDDDKLSNFERAIIDFAQKEREPRAVYRNISLLALAYLSADLNGGGISDNVRLRDLVFVPYPHPDTKQPLDGTPSNEGARINKQWRHLKACVNKSPIIQIMAKNIDDEARLWKMLAIEHKDLSRLTPDEQDNEKKRSELEKTFVEVRKLYKDLSKYFQELRKKGWPASPELPTCTNSSIHISSLTPWYGATAPSDDNAGASDLAHFYFEAKVQGNDDAVTLYILAPPGKSDIGNLPGGIFSAEIESCGHDLVGIYKKMSNMNPKDDPLDDCHRKKFKGLEPERNGEWILLKGKGDGRRRPHSHSVVDLLVDRWAARIEALNYCLPVREFSQDDTKKLCWAALEIGKLIEREISYRANRSAEPIPLTAMEFFRIPISDLCIVDDLQKRRADAKKVNVHIDYRIQNTLYTMHMQDAVRFESRVKDHRSHLARLGERHEGFVRGNLAIWFYLLALTNSIRTPRTPEYSAPKVHRADVNNFEVFGQNLVSLRESIDKAFSEEELAELLDQNDQRWFEQNCGELIGDTRFASPPLLEFKTALPEYLRGLRTRVCNNLRNEGFSELSDDSVDPSEDWPTAHKKVLDNLIFRQYDPYAIAAASLLCQLTNLIHFREAYLKFYRGCFNLRNSLAVSKREIEDNPKFDRLAEVFRQTGARGRVIWSELMEYVEEHDTDQFLQFLTKEPKLYLNPGGIYKRIRNLNHTLNQQRGLAHLDWELGRFDLLGCRLNCLYKNQVFAAFEQLWNSGDPFWGMVTKQPERWKRPVKYPVEYKAFFQDRPDDRQRWLCLRTKHFEDNYYALQIAALVDPEGIHEGFWDKEKKGYNLRRVQLLLGRLFDIFDSEGARQYKSMTWNRQHLRWEYVDWYKTASDIVRSKSVPVRQEDDGIIGFGSFLGETAVDFLMERIDEYRHSKTAEACKVATDAFKALKPLLKNILRCGRSYTEEILKSLYTADENSKEPFSINGDFVNDLYDAAQKLYSGLKNLLNRRDLAPSMSINNKQREAWLHIAERELAYYEQRFDPKCDNPKTSIRSTTPIIFVPINNYKHDPSVKRYEDKLKDIDLNCDSADIETAFNALYDVLANLRREQKRYLFDDGPSDGATKPGLTMRDKENVFYRIQNYVLLYDRSDTAEGDNGQDTRFLGWTSYGLFYYLRSLIPLEVQIRTTLADTLAEQYHDAIYKGAPPTGTEFPRSQMENIAEELDNLDKEMEIDFEDYINRRYFLSKSKDLPQQN